MDENHEVKPSRNHGTQTETRSETFEIFEA